MILEEILIIASLNPGRLKYALVMQSHNGICRVQSSFINKFNCRKIDLFLIGLFVIDQMFLLMFSTDYLDYSVDIMQALCSKVVNAKSKSFCFCHLLAYSSSLMAFLQDSLLDATKEDGLMTCLN